MTTNTALHIFPVGPRKIYHYRFQVAGQRRQRSTRERNKARAQLVARAAFDEANANVNGLQRIPTLAKLIGTWQQVHGPVVSEAHRRGMERFSRQLHELGDIAISDLTTDKVEAARNAHLVGRERSSANHWLRYLKLVVNWAVRRKTIPRLPWDLVELSVQKKPRPVLPQKRTAAWLAAIDHNTPRSPGVRVAVRMMIGMGLREQEAATARWEWCDWERRVYTPGITKGKEAVPVPMPSWLFDYLRPLRKNSGLIAPGRRGRQLPAGYARRPMARANAAIGVVGLTPHRLRGSYATWLSNEGVATQTVQALLRHKHAITTSAYLEPDSEQAVAALRRIEERIAFQGRKSGARRPRRAQPSS